MKKFAIAFIAALLLGPAAPALAAPDAKTKIVQLQSESQAQKAAADELSAGKRKWKRHGWHGKRKWKGHGWKRGWHGKRHWRGYGYWGGRRHWRHHHWGCWRVWYRGHRVLVCR
jgi:hypothetical protein